MDRREFESEELERIAESIRNGDLGGMTGNGSTWVLRVSFLHPEEDEPEDDRYELGTLGAFGSFDAFDTATSIEEAKEAVRREHEEWAEACGYEAAPIEWRETDRGLIGTTQGKDYEHDEDVHEVRWAIRKAWD